MSISWIIWKIFSGYYNLYLYLILIITPPHESLCSLLRSNHQTFKLKLLKYRINLLLIMNHDGQRSVEIAIWPACCIFVHPTKSLSVLYVSLIGFLFFHHHLAYKCTTTKRWPAFCHVPLDPIRDDIRLEPRSLKDN